MHVCLYLLYIMCAAEPSHAFLSLSYQSTSLFNCTAIVVIITRSCRSCRSANTSHALYRPADIMQAICDRTCVPLIGSAHRTTAKRTDLMTHGKSSPPKKKSLSPKGNETHRYSSTKCGFKDFGGEGPLSKLRRPGPKTTSKLTFSLIR